MLRRWRTGSYPSDTDKGSSALPVRSRTVAPKIDQYFALYRRHWEVLPRRGVHEVFHALGTAIRAARKYIYLEDQ